MSTDFRETVFNAGPFQSYWWADEHEPVHLFIRARLDHEVDPETLSRAWERTKKVYPLLDLVPDDEDEEVLFLRGEGAGIPVRSRVPLRPAGAAARGRGEILTWFGDTVTLACYHSVLDEYGLHEVFRTLLACYFSIRLQTGIAPGVMTREGRRPEEYFVQNTMLPAEGYTPRPVMLCRDVRSLFEDPEIVRPEGAEGASATVTVPFSGLEKLRGEAGVSLETLLLSLFAEMIHEMYPEEKRTLCLAAMTDFRDAFSVPESIAPCSKKMPVMLKAEELASGGPEALRARIGAIRAAHLDPDYLRSHVAMENTYSVLNLRNACLSLQFSGNFDIGDATRHIADLSMGDYSLRSVFLLRLGDELKTVFQYGTATGKYAAGWIRTLEKRGIPARLTAGPLPVPAEAEMPMI